jgi:hypothetical protein
MKKIILLAVVGVTVLRLAAQNKVGINTSTPGHALEVFDAANQGFAVLFNSNNTDNSFIQIQSGAAASNIGVGLYRSGVAKGYLYINSNNHLVLNAGAANLIVSAAGYVGVNQFSPGFPLNFESILGDKIALYGNNGPHYGFGIQNSLLQIHTDNVNADIAFGSGSSANFTERMRIKGNGNVGIGTSNPLARLQVVQKGLYSYTEGAANALELRDTSGTDHILYMGADATNQVGYIQSVAAGSFRDLLLQGRGGSVIVGNDQASALSVRGDLVVDNAGNNNGGTGYGIRFGTPGSGEAISSQRSAGGNQYGLGFFTNSTNRLQITNGGSIIIPGNIVLTGTINNYQAFVTDISGQRQKLLMADAPLGGGFPQGYMGSAFFTINPGNFTAKPVAWVTSFAGTGDCHKIVVTTEVLANGSGWDVKLHLTNTSTGSINFSGTWKVLVMGAY